MRSSGHGPGPGTGRGRAVTLRFAKSADQDLSSVIGGPVSAEENGQVVAVFRGTTYLSADAAAPAERPDHPAHRRGHPDSEGGHPTEKVTVDEETVSARPQP